MHSIKISITREFLEYEEPFRFEDGEHLEVDADKKYEKKNIQRPCEEP